MPIFLDAALFSIILNKMYIQGSVYPGPSSLTTCSPFCIQICLEPSPGDTTSILDCEKDLLTENPVINFLSINWPAEGNTNPIFYSSVGCVVTAEFPFPTYTILAEVRDIFFIIIY